MCFAFFFISAVALAGIQTFASTSLVSLYGMSLATATSAYTCFMFASAAGMVYGGFLGAGSRNHDRIIMIAFGSAALLALVLAAAAVPAWMAVVLMGLIGLVTGISGPSRDLMIRARRRPTPPAACSAWCIPGLDSGLAVGAMLFGALMDATIRPACLSSSPVPGAGDPDRGGRGQQQPRGRRPENRIELKSF
jgi:predicted MFS family arabinose efflux permease